MMNKLFLPLIALLFLSGCASLNSNFDCAAKPGGVCASLSQVNNMVDTGQLGRGKSKKVKPDEEIPTPVIGLTPYPANDSKTYQKPLRAGELVMRVWLAPFEDSQGYYHQASELFVVTKPGRWLGASAHSLKG
jgi:conjugal transfer pilus assembly protein TraV